MCRLTLLTHKCGKVTTFYDRCAEWDGPLDPLKERKLQGSIACPKANTSPASQTVERYCGLSDCGTCGKSDTKTQSTQSTQSTIGGVPSTQYYPSRYYTTGNLENGVGPWPGYHTKR